MLTGAYYRSFDDKQRFAIPKRVRDVLGPKITTLFAAPGMDGSLALYSEDAFSSLADQLAGHSPTEEDVRAFSRLFYAQAQSVDMDRQGRVRIPPDLCQWAGLEKEIVLLGVRDHLELWQKQRWESYLSEKQQHYDQLAERAFHANLNAPALVQANSRVQANSEAAVESPPASAPGPAKPR